MKYLDIPSLALLSSALSYSSPECKVHTRFEAYSCKEVKKERKLRRELEEVWKGEVGEVDDLSISPEDKLPLFSSPFGDLHASSSRKIHFLLVSTLNQAYPDYDFTHLGADEFEREPAGVIGILAALSGVVRGGVDRTGSSPRSYGSYPTAILTPPQFSSSLPPSSLPEGTTQQMMDLSNIAHPTLLKILREVIDLDDCIAYSYNPSADCDPHAEDDDPDDEDVELGDGGDDASSANRPGESGRREGSDSFVDRDGDRDHADVFAYSDDEEGMIMDMELDDPTAEKERRLKRDAMKESRNRIRRESMMDVGQAERGNGGLLWSVNYFFYSKRQRRILFISVWARKRQSAFLAPITMPLHNPFKTYGLHHHSSSPRGGFASSSMPSLTGLAESIHKELRSAPPRAAEPGAMISTSTTTTTTTTKLPMLDRTSASPQKGGSRPRRRRRSESVASNRSGVSIRARGKRIKA